MDHHMQAAILLSSSLARSDTEKDQGGTDALQQGKKRSLVCFSTHAPLFFIAFLAERGGIYHTKKILALLAFMFRVCICLNA
jgi:hypothetical protein